MTNKIKYILIPIITTIIGIVLDVLNMGTFIGLSVILLVLGLIFARIEYFIDRYNYDKVTNK